MKLYNQARKYGSQLALVAGGSALSASAFAQAAANPFTTIFAAVDLSTIVAAVVAASLVVIAIAMAFKAPDLGKRVIRKV